MYYESFLNSIQPSNVIPESASFNDMAIFANRAIQDAYNETAISLVSNEMAVFESVMLHEADGDQDQVQSAKFKKSALDKVKDFFRNIWETIKEFFKKLIDKIKGFFEKKQMEAMKRLLNNFDEAVKIYRSVPQAKNDEFGYCFNPDYAANNLKLYQEEPKMAAEWAQQAFNKLKAIGKESRDSTAGEEALEAIDFTKEKIEEEFLPKDANLKKYLKAILRGEEYKDADISAKRAVQFHVNGANVPNIANKIKDLISNVKKWLDETKKSYNESKKAIDKMMKQAKDLVNINHRSVKAYCKCCKKLNSIMTKYIGAITSVYKKAYSDAVRLVKQVVSKAKGWQSEAKKEKKSTNESYEYSFSSYDPMNEAFDFYLEEDEVSEDEDEDFDSED